MSVYLSPTAIGGLMHEHRVILRAVSGMNGELDRLAGGGEVDHLFIREAVDFIRSYADRCHHGKEEDILFRDLGSKPLTPADRADMDRLVSDHVWARARTRELEAASDRHVSGDAAALEDIKDALETLVAFYPEHIEREDRGFFVAARGYFSEEELAAMADECAVFERSLIHERYVRVADELEQRALREG